MLTDCGFEICFLCKESGCYPSEFAHTKCYLIDDIKNVETGIKVCETCKTKWENKTHHLYHLFVKDSLE
jgi:hypothetical protein